MTELKTLKDWRQEVSTIDEFKIHRMQIFRCEEWLWKEAIKNIKHLRSLMEEACIPKALGETSDIKWIKHFFNITEEDLK